MSFYTGTETNAQKDQEVQRFLKGDTNIFCLSSRSGAGLDGLQERCSVIVHGELDWSPQVHSQCRGRIFRDGQKKSVMEYYLVADGGSDPIIADILGIKKSQSEGILNPKHSGLEVQAETGRVKKLAAAYLEKDLTADDADWT